MSLYTMFMTMKYGVPVLNRSNFDVGDDEDRIQDLHDEFDVQEVDDIKFESA